MNYKLIMLPQPILVNSKPEEGISPHVTYFDDKVEENNIYIGSKMFSGNKTFKYIKGIDENNRTVYEIIAGTHGLPKLNLSLIAKGIGWVDVEKLAYKAAQKRFKLEHIPLLQIDEYGGEIKEFVDVYIDTYKAVQNEKKYSDEDLFNLLKMVHDKRLDSLSARIVDNGRVTDFNFWNSYFKKEVYASELISEFIQSLSKPKEYLVEVSVENSAIKDFLGHPVISEVPKITNNTITVTKVLK